MKNLLTNPIKERVIHELKTILYNHPKYREDSEFVQNKFSFSERPKRGIVIDGVSAERVRLSADNYVGSLSSFCMLTWADEKPTSNSLEWIRENFQVLEKISPNRSIFPASPGVYVITVTKVPDVGAKIPGEFSIDPSLDEENETLITFQDSSDTYAQLSRLGVLPASLRLWLNGKVLLIPNVDYTYNSDTGEIHFIRNVPVHETVSAFYRYSDTPIHGIQFWPESTNTTAIPGVILAFGERIELGCKQAVVVTDKRVPVAQVFGGKFELNFNLTLFTRDAEDREKMTDYVVLQFLRLQNNLAFEGIELMDISPGGENEDVYDQTDGTYFYESSISLSLRSDWEIQVPLPITLARVENHSREQELEFGHLDGTYIDDLVKVQTLSGQSISIRTGDNLSYERIR